MRKYILDVNCYDEKTYIKISENHGGCYTSEILCIPEAVRSYLAGALENKERGFKYSYVVR